MNINALIPLEINLINKLLAAHNVQARTLAKLTMCVKSSFIAYGLQLAPGESVSKVERVQRELSNELTRQRVRLLSGYTGKTIARLRDYPLAVEVPHPAPTPLSWHSAAMRTGRYMALVGRSYDYAGAKEEYLDLERHYHTLVAAMSGGGKSTLMRMALITLALNTSPDDLQMMLVDLKNDDLMPFRALPHCINYAGDIDSAAAAIAYVHEVKTERIATQEKPYRLLLVIDELAELSTDKDALKQLGSILSTGRSLGINVMAGTQYPTAATIGSVVNASFTVRIVGMVDGKEAAHTATKRAKSGAELLCTPGDFLRVDGNNLIRMKAYDISQDDTAMLIKQIAGRKQAQNVARAELNRMPKPQLARIPDEVLPIFHRFTDQSGNLERGALAAALRALYGNDAPQSGKRYQMEAERISTWHKEYLLHFTSPDAGMNTSTTGRNDSEVSEVKYLDGKIIKLRKAG